MSSFERLGIPAALYALAALLTGGCASLGADSIEENGAGARAEVARFLDKPLTAEGASRIAVAYSPSFQAIVAENAAQSAQAAQSARLPNPVFTFEHLVRGDDAGADKEIKRMLSISVLDVLFLPARMRAADHRQEQLRISAAKGVLQTAAAARQAWVRAVAAQQAAGYAEQVMAAAEAGTELARRMEQVGNFSKLQRAREQAFHADGVAQLARSRYAATTAREELVRALGLDTADAGRLVLPDRLPDLPARPDDEAAVERVALAERLDVRMARADLEYVAQQQGLTRITSYVDGLKVAGEHNSASGRAAWRGYEVEMPLPIFDFGDARRAVAQAEYMAAFYRAASVGASASSQVRQSYSAYRTAHDVARQYRDEIVPLRKAIAEEMLLRYNGMLTGVFELLADARDQIGSVMQAIDAERDFWLADSQLRLALAGAQTKESP